jgi:hypothetical protein
MNRTHALGFISFVMLASAGAFFACSSDNGGTTPGVTQDSGVHDTATAGDTATGGDTGTGDDTATPPTDTGTSDAQCSKVTTLHPPSADAGGKTIYCPFSSDGGPDAANVYCQSQTEHCCEQGAGSTTPTTCIPTATTCTGTKTTDWQCQDPVDCPSSSPVCCAPGASIGLGAPGCGNFAHTMTGTTCVAAGACTGIVMCTSNAECPSGQTCTPFGKAGAQVGGCM